MLPAERRWERSPLKFRGPGWVRTSEACATVLQTVPFGHSGTDPGPRTIAVTDSLASGGSHADIRCRVAGRHARGSQRGGPSGPRDLDPLRLQGPVSYTHLTLPTIYSV